MSTFNGCLKESGAMQSIGRIARGALALALLGAVSLGSAVEPSIPLRISLTIPEICSIGTGARRAADAGVPSVRCQHGTPFMLSRARPSGPHSASPSDLGTGASPAWTVTF
ncbi:hypothetical protein [Burkholderia sp. JKS000303]|uniref:hypothetical protein n=1 Tax=Burkholderia sp. JKS000303 TaxID=1938747 RepID=UPI0011800CA5|nr:hypothetical protein [Burkholderia sp. JKS000303]